MPSRKSLRKEPNAYQILVARILPVLQKIHGSDDASLQQCLTEEDVRSLISDVKALFWFTLSRAGVNDDVIRMMSTKFHDAGRRSPPWQAGSARGTFRRPQDGADGNRQRRWLFPTEHKFYAGEIVATLTEVRFYFQTLSMDGAPHLQGNELRDPAIPILGHPLEPGKFLDPISKLPVKFTDFVQDRRAVESGHIIPLGSELDGVRGRHNVQNATLMLRDSNRIQADMTVPELMQMFEGILRRHGYSVVPPRPPS